MQMFLRVTAALGLGFILLAAGEAPDFGQDDAVVASVQSAQLVAGTQGVGPLMITDSEESEPVVDEPSLEIAKAKSLAALVNDVRQDADARMGDDLRCLATAVYFESKGEPLDGQLAVAQVILNRVKDGRFGRSICAVVKAPKQFSFVRGGSLPAPSSLQQWAVAQAIAEIALEGSWDSSVSNATYFHATRVNPGWKMRRLASVGNHVFYR